jgi:hypothetical protein
MDMYLSKGGVICKACLDGNHMSYGHDHRTGEENRADCKNVGVVGDTVVQCCCVVGSVANSSRTLKRKAVAGALWYACKGMLLCLFVAILSFAVAYFQIIV